MCRIYMHKVESRVQILTTGNLLLNLIDRVIV